MRLDSSLRRTVTLPLLLPLFVGAVLGCLTSEARAQLPTRSSLACMNEIPASAFTRVPVHLVLSERDADAKRLRKDATPLVRRVADRTRALLGAERDSPPIGEPRITWETYGGSLVITVHRRGAVTWYIDRSTDSLVVAHTDSGSLADSAVTGWLLRQHDGAVLLDEAMRAEIAAQAPTFVWPRSIRADSLSFNLRFVHPAMREANAGHTQLEEPPAFPVFTMLAPPMVRGREIGSDVPVRYPRYLLARGISGEVNLRFIIDADGRPDPASMHDIWYSSKPRPKGERALDYGMFVESARRATLSTHYAPKRIGGCAVRELVEKPFEFRMQ